MEAKRKEEVTTNSDVQQQQEGSQSWKEASQEEVGVQRLSQGQEQNQSQGAEQGHNPTTTSAVVVVVGDPPPYASASDSESPSDGAVLPSVESTAST